MCQSRHADAQVLDYGASEGCNPHAALRAAVPINAMAEVNAMVDGWMGEDWFHNGAFSKDSLTNIRNQEATRGSDIGWSSDHYETFGQ
jgi:hypothetical protein